MASSQLERDSAAKCPIDHGNPKELIEKGSLLDPIISAHPKPYYDAMRSLQPVHFDERLGSWLISRWEDIETVQRDPVTYSVKHGYEAMFARGFFDEFKAILEEKGGGYFPDAIMSDPPYHTHIRKLMEQAFTAHRVKSLEGDIRDVIVDVIEQMLAKQKAGETIDGVKDFGVPITIRVICAQLGIPQFNADDIQRWSHAVTQQIGAMQDREGMVHFANEICELQNFLIAEVRDREATPREDMISDLVHAKIDDPDKPKLTFKEVVSLVRATMIAGNETTATGMANLLFVLATQPKVLQQLKDQVDDDRLMNRFVEELLRIEPPVRALSRMAIKEVELGGATIPEGGHMLLVYGSGNDDETVFPCPRDFDTTRGNLSRHVAFGGGPHKCIGLALARMEIRIAARELIRRIDGIKLEIAVDDIKYLPTVATRSMAALPVSFTPKG